MAGARQIRGRALGKRLQCHEHDACRRAVDEAVDGEARKGDGALDARFLQSNGRHLANDRFAAVQRGTIGELGEADEILLVLNGHEA